MKLKTIQIITQILIICVKMRDRLKQIGMRINYRWNKI